MDESRFSISAPALYGRLGTASAPVIIDVRRQPAFGSDGTVVAGSIRRPPDQATAANYPDDDHAMLEQGMIMYDALYAWCRSLQSETHNWKPAA